MSSAAKPRFSTAALKNANNVMFGAALISICVGLVVFGLESAPKRPFFSDAVTYSWGAFMTSWVLSMLVGFVTDLLKSDGPVRRISLMLSLGIGAIHFAFWPVYLVSRL